jgi:hypothetical protein
LRNDFRFSWVQNQSRIIARYKFQTFNVKLPVNGYEYETVAAEQRFASGDNEPHSAVVRSIVLGVRDGQTLDNWWWKQIPCYICYRCLEKPKNFSVCWSTASGNALVKSK